MKYRIVETPTGPFILMVEPECSLCTSWLSESVEEELERAGAQESPRLEPSIANRLKRYFAGEPVDFVDIPTPRGPDFFRRCWDACRAIERGRTISYAQLARCASGSSAGARAAGQAMRNNPLPIIVPCHRVIASGGRLGGFGGSDDPSGLTVSTKRFLLAMEGARAAADEKNERHLFTAA